MKISDILSEEASAGSTSSGNIAGIANPHISPGAARGKSSYIGSPGKSGKKAPPQPKIKSIDAVDAKNVSLFGGPPHLKR